MIQLVNRYRDIKNKIKESYRECDSNVLLKNRNSIMIHLITFRHIDIIYTTFIEIS